MEIFTEIRLINGDYCKILMLNGGVISRANKACQMQYELDVVPYIMEQACLINNFPRKTEYYLMLSIDDYSKISDCLNAAVSKCTP